MVYIHPERSDAAAVAAVPKGGSHDPWFCFETGRMFACTPDPENPGAAASLFHAASYVLHTQRYGTPAPRWMAVGEGLVIGSRIETGKSLPSVGWLYRNIMPADPLPLERLSDQSEKIEDRGYHGLAWVAFFRAGPSRYRKAYSDFVEEFDETGDWRAAMETQRRNSRAEYFKKPVDYVRMRIPDYPIIVKRPMDLGTVNENLRSK